MKATELMIGDWVYVHHSGKAPHYGKVTALLSSGAVETEINGSLALSSSVEPIPLTPEILEKNGFVCSEKSSRKPYQFRDGSTYISIIKGRLNARYYEKIGKPMNAMQIDCNYVHELQHALRLCGIDKEITI